MPEENRKHPECQLPVRNRREWLGWLGRQVSLAAFAALAALLGFRRGSPASSSGSGSAQGGRPFCIPGMETGMARFRCRSCPGSPHCPLAEGSRTSEFFPSLRESAPYTSVTASTADSGPRPLSPEPNR